MADMARSVMPSRPDQQAHDEPATQEKSFVCSHPGCTKRFTRAEHLQRHALNHAPGGLACELCRAHFKRPDLLKRHMERHRQKDLEAGGPGCGTLDTRKRAWATPDGSVVQKRPCLNGETDKGPTEQVAQQEPSPDPEPCDVTESLVNSDALFFSNAGPEAVQHPPIDCLPFGEEARQHQQHQPPQVFNPHSPISQACFDSNPGAQNQSSFIPYDSSWTDLAIQQNISELEYDQIFQPDTASSFNMPYTTALDYNWLFNIRDFSLPLEKDTGSLGPNNSINIDAYVTSKNSFAASPVSMNSSQLWSEPQQDSVQDMDPRRHNSIASNQTRDENFSERAHQSFITESPISGQGTERRVVSAASSPAELIAQKRRNPVTLEHPPSLERPFSSIQSIHVPEIDDDVRQSILNVIEASNPCFPEQRESMWQDPLLSTTSLQSYLDLFFTRFNTAYPLIHLASFNPAEIEPLLLLSILLLGATYSGKDSHQLAVCIHDSIRPQIFAHAGFSPQPKLWALQTILLVECFGKSRAGQKQHEMSHLFHGLLINLIRRSDCQCVQPVGPPTISDENHEGSLRQAWLKWTVAEQKKRLALLCFMWDTQHAVLFCQSLCMSAFELRVNMPCTQGIWEARDPALWAAAWRSTPSADHGTPYLVALKSYLSPSVPRPSNLTILARVLILHGLMSIAWDMERRDQTALGVIAGGSVSGRSGWKRMISSAYDRWEKDFSAHCTASIARLQNAQRSGRRVSNAVERTGTEEAQISEIAVYAAAYQALYHAVKVLLNMDFLDVQIYAGARHILGRPVQQRDFLRSVQIVKRWAASSSNDTLERAQGSNPPTPQYSTDSQDSPAGNNRVVMNPASIAAKHAANMLHLHTRTLTTSKAMSLFHVPWCLYLVTLTCWAYHHARPNNRPSGSSMGLDEIDEDDEMIWNPQSEMESLVASMAQASEFTNLPAAKRQANGLVWTMAEILTKVRWGIVHAGVTVLKGLVPQRLVNQYDEPLEWSHESK
ncbi:unnamed protein product [Clonostachys rhizophaga]|uniref:C2H2-type domain-containing protein n=1 Tax=Clonostachys rhizophaga TaxID=160324 RepID=A0A9N9YR22_9HYPO|nr:unnamed protein product [Clonostachys rhizophaga]